jgi:hypothetical protein
MHGSLLQAGRQAHTPKQLQSSNFEVSSSMCGRIREHASLDLSLCSCCVLGHSVTRLEHYAFVTKKIFCMAHLSYQALVLVNKLSNQAMLNVTIHSCLFRQCYAHEYFNTCSNTLDIF